jgi:hypothetical protein
MERIAPMQPGSRWLALHVYYHSEQNRLLHRFVGPLVAELWRSERIDSFFFIRYGLGGPHLRLRLRAPADSATALEAEVLAATREFLREHPSPRSLSAESIDRSNRAVLARDPQENDGAIYPDNWARFAPFVPETERYGGPDLLPGSLDFFALSSARALELLAQPGEGAESLPLSSALQLLVRQALGFSRSCEELVALLEYSLPRDGTAPEAIARKVDVWEAPSPLRRRILASQQHMTANRLGLRNVDELYLSCLLQKVAREFAHEESTLWSQLDDRLSEPPVSPGPPQPGSCLEAARARLISRQQAAPPGARIPP